MPSPFPGVDPDIEATGSWSDLHWRFITFLASYLTPMVRPRYYPRIDRRITRTIVPDVGVFEHVGRSTPNSSTAVEADAAVLVEEQVEEARQGFIEIVDRDRGDRVVTIIEVLSPDNKIGGGRDLYIRKQNEVLQSKVHLVEMDFLFVGSHTVAVPRALLIEKIAQWDFLVTINRYPERWRHEVYPFRLPQRLPRIRIPLTSPDSDVVADLQLVFTRCYDESPFRDLFDYRQPPPGLKLSPDNATWLQQWLSQAGYRSVQTTNGIPKSENPQ